MMAENSLRKKAQLTQERAERFKDPRMRQMGIDKAALDEQVKERAALEAIDKERESFFDKQAMLMDQHAQVLQREVDEVRRQRERETRDFRATFQNKELGRDWDLNDPKKVTNGLPARVCDDDPRCGAASMQKFEGEDLDMKDRRVTQQAQQRRWVEQQVAEKQTKAWMEKDATRKYEDRAEEMAFRTWQIEQEVAAQRKQALKTAADFNKALAEQKRQEKLQSRMRETMKNLEEMENQLGSDLLCERASPMNGRDTQSTRFKGLGDERLRTIAATQESQRHQLAEKRRLEAEEERQLAQQALLENRMGLALDRQRERERREAAVRLGQERLQQSKEAAERRKQLDEQYRNEIREEYFVYGKCM